MPKMGLLPDSPLTSYLLDYNQKLQKCILMEV